MFFDTSAASREARSGRFFLHCNYRPSDEVSEAIKGATLGWANAKDEESQEQTQEPENPSNTDPNPGEIEEP